MYIIYDKKYFWFIILRIIHKNRRNYFEFNIQIIILTIVQTNETFQFFKNLPIIHLIRSKLKGELS